MTARSSRNRRSLIGGNPPPDRAAAKRSQPPARQASRPAVLRDLAHPPAPRNLAQRLSVPRRETLTPERRASRERRPIRPAPTPPPVVARASRVAALPASSVTPQPLPHQSPRRRFEVALPAPGARLRLPAMPEISLNWRAISGTLTILLTALVLFIFTSPTYTIRFAEIDGAQRLTAADLNTVLGLSGQMIFSVDPQQVRQRLLQAFPELKTVSVSVGLPAQVHIVIEERQPVLAWQIGGQLYWLDQEGVAFQPRMTLDAAAQETLAETLVTVEAKDYPPGVKEGAFKSVSLKTATLQFDPRWVAAFQSMATQAPQGSTLLYSAERGMGWQDSQGWEVFIGVELAGIDQKLLVYRALMERLQQDGITPTLISVESPHAPYYRAAAVQSEEETSNP